jgi:chemotaxis protein CheD
MKERAAQMAERRQSREMPVASYFDGTLTCFDANEHVRVIKVLSGHWHVSTHSDEMCTTVLGSCVSACIRDPVARVGGMNHFLLPGDEGADSQISLSARYGVFAMESLINGLLKAGGRKDRLEVKVFGGGNVINHSVPIGTRNAEFIRGFLRREGLHIVSEDLEGLYPRRVHYYPHTGKVMLRHLQRRDDLIVVAEEDSYSRKVSTQPVEGEIELF